MTKFDIDKKLIYKIQLCFEILEDTIFKIIKRITKNKKVKKKIFIINTITSNLILENLFF